MSLLFHKFQDSTQFCSEWSCYFLVIKDVNITSDADDNTIYQSGKNVDDVINGLQFSAEKLFHWFNDNQIKGNTDKNHLLWVQSLIKTHICEKSLGFKIDYKLTFDNHVKSIQ